MRRAIERGSALINLNWRRSLGLVLQSLRESGILKDSIVVLTGSYVHGKETSKSDIDVLVLRRGSTKRLRPPYGVHLHFEDLDEFRKRLAEGDDFVIDAVRFGKVLHDGLGLWRVLREEMEGTKWPNWRGKIRQAERRIKLAEGLLASGDLDAATEEYLLTATHVARAQLLRRGIFPMSRPQLRDQLLAIGESGLAGHLDLLMGGDCEEPRLRRIGLELRKTIEEQKAPR